MKKSITINDLIRHRPDEVGVVRVHPCNMDKTAQKSDKFYRMELVRIHNPATGKWVVRHIAGGTNVIRERRNSESEVLGIKKDTLALDYDAELELGIYDGKADGLVVTPANMYHKMVFAWNHPSRPDRIMWRFGTILTLIGFRGDAYAAAKWFISIF